MQRLTAMACLILAMGIAGCAKSASRMEMASAPMSAMAPAFEGEAKAMARGAGATAGEVMLAQAPAPLATQQPRTPLRADSRKIVYEGWLTLQVFDLTQALEEVEGIVRRMEGYISSLTERSDYAEITLRVPVAHFEDALSALARTGKLEQRQIQAQDVTEEWMDLEARLRNLRREEERLLQLLQKAGKVSELLEVERELARVRGEIEQGEGRLRYLDNLVTLCTIHLTLRLPGGEPTEGWSVRAVWADSERLFISLGRAAITLVLRLVVLVPYLLAVVAVLWGAARLVRRRAQPRKGA